MILKYWKWWNNRSWRQWGEHYEIGLIFSACKSWANYNASLLSDTDKIKKIIRERDDFVARSSRIGLRKRLHSKLFLCLYAKKAGVCCRARNISNYDQHALTWLRSQQYMALISVPIHASNRHIRSHKNTMISNEMSMPIAILTHVDLYSHTKLT